MPVGHAFCLKGVNLLGTEARPSPINRKRVRPDVGIVLSAAVFLPIVLGAWLDHASLVSRANGYLRERARYLGQRATCSQTVSENESTPEPR